jgi:DNA-binding NtrC family response regulator
LTAGADFYGMIGRSPLMRQVFERIERFARSPIPVLILGETGTGKDMAARAIRQIAGPDRPFVALNCAAIPETLIESELFGHERGAFTGAVRQHTGIIAQADGGILFLDEIAELPVHTQAKLLRVVETGEYRRVGGEKILRSDFRLIAATSTNLDERAAQGRFRLDLLYRLGSARLVLPPLRERKEDIDPLAKALLLRYREMNGGAGPSQFSSSARDLLHRCDWPGNVRQLRNVIEASAAITQGATVHAPQLAEFIGRGMADAPEAGLVPRLAEVVRRAEAQAIEQALRAAAGNRSRAADLLGIAEATLYRKLRPLRIHPLGSSTRDPFSATQ